MPVACPASLPGVGELHGASLLSSESALV